MSKYSYVLLVITLLITFSFARAEGLLYNNNPPLPTDSLITIDTTSIAENILVIRQITHFKEVILDDTIQTNGQLQIKKITIDHTNIVPLDTLYLESIAANPKEEITNPTSSIPTQTTNLTKVNALTNDDEEEENSIEGYSTMTDHSHSDDSSSLYSSTYYFKNLHEPQEAIVVAESTGEPIEIQNSSAIESKEKIEITESAPASRAGLPGAKVLERRSITPKEAYNLTLVDIEKRRKAFADDLQRANTEKQKQEIIATAATYFEEAIAIDVVHYWYGTSFDKEGMAKNPNEGKIACSYFITTVLKDAGLKVNRVKLAQQSAQNIAKTLCNANKMKRLTTPSEVKNYVQKNGKGLYVIGFSFHVGFLYHDGMNSYLIHASPLPPGTVARLPIDGARSFDYSKFYDVGKLSDNKNLIRKWLKGEKVY